MTDVEDLLRETMHAHAGQAPAAAQFRFRAPQGTAAGRRPRWVAAVAAVSCALVVAVIAMLARQPARHAAPLASPRPGVTAAPALGCPAKIDPAAFVPAPPPSSPGLRSATQLVPFDVPVRAVVCAYLHNSATLTGSRELGGHLAAIPAELAWLPPVPVRQPCAAYLAFTDGDNYRLGLSYPAGTVWLSVPGNHCDGASNGQYVVGNLRAQADAAYRTGAWAAPTPATVGSCQWSAGRRGQQDQLVPGTPVSVQVCGQSGRAVRATAAELAALRAALNALPTTPWASSISCPGGAPPPAASYRLTFGYLIGPPVQVTVNPGCRPAVNNGNLQAVDAATVLPLVLQMFASQ